MSYTQDKRLIAVETPLGKDVLLLQNFEGSEAISRLFRFQLSFLSTNHAVPFKDIVGKNVTIRMRLEDDSERYINGFVSRFSQGSTDQTFTAYQAEVVPWLWFLTRTADCRIFQNKTIPDIIQQIFTDLGFMDFKLQLQGSFAPWEYCVQYRETDFNFVSRLMEQEGIYYFFEHEKNRHTLVLANSSTAHKACPKKAKARYQTTMATALREDVITAWQNMQEFRPGKFALTDYNFETPSTSLMANVPSTVQLPSIDKFEIYDYPGEHSTKSEGETYAKVRMEEEESVHMVVGGGSDCRAFISGYCFDLAEHPRKEWNNKPYVLTEVHHSASVGTTYRSGDDSAAETYRNSFTCIPKSIPFRPLRITPKPIVQGPQTAVVTGPKGEEIYPDKYGRVKVQFHWDREGKKDENSSCWIRVSAPWAGKSWGFIQIPRIGQEVIVEFLEGDPDQPIITGRVYNAEQMPPYTLPANKTVSGVLTRSSQNGGTKNANEIYIEDKKDVELIRIHAEKNFDLSVEHDTQEYVNHDRHLIVKNDQKEEVRNNLHLHTKGEKREKVDRISNLEVGEDSRTKVGQNMHVEAIQDIVHKAGKNYHVSVMADHHTKANKSFAVEAGATAHIKAGVTLVLEAVAGVTLKGPGGHVTINPAGVFIVGNMVFINSGGAPLSGSGASPGSPQAPAAPIAPTEASHGSSGMEDK